MPTLRADWTWCEAMLPAVSRTFALCIRFLPEDLRRSVTLSYLLCRVADTVEDAPELASADKAALLARLVGALDDPTISLEPLHAVFAARTDADAHLTARAADVLAVFHAQPVRVRDAVAPWVAEMCRGMAEFAAREPEVGDGVGGRPLRGLRSEADLDRYCYFVAGTVGRLLTALFAAERPQLSPATIRGLESRAEDFGTGLQLVNILADVARDHERGVCYVPEQWRRQAGIGGADLLSAAQRPATRRVLTALAERARFRLRAARDYCQLLPHGEYQLRLFCLVPYFLALRTLRALLADPRYPSAGQRVKVGRSVVHRTLVAAQVCAASNHMLRAYSRRLDGAIDSSQLRLDA
ncbi:MAG: squalene/phytoene synthase family protein [Candidatus Krumholzibacteriia bacterium]